MTDGSGTAGAGEQATRALASLVGRPLRGSAREENALFLDFDSHSLQVLCAWRLARDAEVIAGSGDLYTPADPDADPEDFDFTEAGATWWDVRMRAFHGERDDAPPVVRSVHADALLGIRLELDDGTRLDVFPHSAPAAHVITEHWRLMPDVAGTATWVASSQGLEQQ